jgi:hypothetical protein
MNQEYYRYISQIHKQQLQISQRQMELSRVSPLHPNLRSRFLLTVSDVLLGIGQRIRPAGYQVYVHPGGVQEGSLEIEAGGC